MPCDSSYMHPHAHEIEMSHVFALLDEAEGRTPMGLKPDPGHWDGYHPKAYSKYLTRAERDAAVSALCAILQVDPNVSRYSLEMQAWWRDHQEHDRQRLMVEQAALERQSEREAALAKLTPYERMLLGLKD